jgi:peptidoglycan/LPS O-acetylase OafA/YrhL
VFSTSTIQARMDRSTAGFDYLRLALATGVLVFHSYTLGFPASTPTPALIRGAASIMVPGFFSVSGFLVAGSVARHTLPIYFLKRALRVLPGLAVSVLLTVFVLGPVLTQDPLYWSRATTWEYLLNMAGLSVSNLPGVFRDNPIRNTNGSLWTIGFELSCYWALACVSLVVFRWRAVMLAATVVGLLIYPAVYLSAALLPVSILPVAYAIVGLGTVQAPRLRADYSYGVYVAAFPIQQALIGAGAVFWAWNLALALPLTFAYAALSWRFVERPATQFRTLRLGSPQPLMP